MWASRTIRIRSLALIVAMATMAALALQATPARATTPDAGVAELKTMVADVGTWTAGLADAGKLAEKVPLVGSSAGSVLGFPDLVQKAVADQITTLDNWSDYGGSAKTVDLGASDGRTGNLTLTNSGSGTTHTVTFHLELARTLSSQPFGFSSESPKVNLSSAGGVSVHGAITLDFAVGVDTSGVTPLAYVVNDASSSPHFAVDVTASLPTGSSSLTAAIGILGVNVTADVAHHTASIHLAASVDDPDGDGKLYRTKPDGTDGELKDLTAAAGLVHVGFASGNAGSIDADLTLTATSNASMSLPSVNATVGVHWADISAGSPTVTVSGLDPVAAFLRLSPRDLADMLGQLVSIINGSERSPFNKPLPFLSGTLADAVKGAEALVDFLSQNVVQPPAAPSDPVDPAKVGEPSFRSIQELIQKLDDYTGTGDFAGSTFEVTVGTYDVTTNRLPIDLKLKRTVASPIDLVKSTVAVTGSGTYTATTLADSTREFAADVAGRRVIAGSSGGTVQSISVDKHTLTLTGDGWVGGTPVAGTTYSVSGPEVDAGTVNLANLIGDAGKKIVNANGIQPTATITPDYTARLKFALDLSAPKTGTACAGTPTGDPADPTATECPFTRTNLDGTHVVVTEVPLPVERLLIGTGYDLLKADFPASAGIDVYAKAGFLKVKIGGSVKFCRKTANADCTGTGTDPMLTITLNSVTGDPADGYVPVAELFGSLIGSGVNSRLSVATSVRGYASGSVSVPDAASFLPSGGTAGFTATFGDITNPASLSVSASDLSEILNFDIDKDNPQALLGIVLRALQLLDDQLAQGDPSGSSVLSKKLPLVDLSMRDLLASDEEGGGSTVTYAASTFDTDGAGPAAPVATTKLTDTSRTDERVFPTTLIGRSVVVGTKVGIVLDVQDSGTTLQLTKLSEVPAAATSYSLRTELADAISLLSAAPPDSVQELVKVLNGRLGHTTPFTFAYKLLGTGATAVPSLLITLDWNRKFSRSSPIKFDIGSDTLAGTAGSGTADVTVSTSLNAGVAIPLAIPADGLSGVPLKLLDNSSLSIDASAEVNGTVRANLGPLALSLGNPDADTSNDATAKAHYKLGLSKAGGTADTASDLTTFLSAVALNVNDYSGGVDCGEGTASPNEDLALCASLPFYLSTNDGTSWTRLQGASSNDLGISLRLPRAGSSVSDLFGLTGNVSTGDTRARLAAPSASDLSAAFSAALLNFGTIGDGLDAFLEMVQNALNDASQQGKLPLVGDDLQAGADFVGKLRTHFDALFAEVKGVNGGKLPDAASINTYLNTKFNAALTAAGANASNFELAITCLLKQSDVSSVTATVKQPPPPPVTDPPTPTSTTPTPTTYTYGVIAVGTFNHADIDTVIGTTSSANNEATLSADSFNTVHWSTRPNAQKYKVVRQDNGGDWHVVATVTGTSSSSYKDDGTDTPDAAAYAAPTEEATVDVCTGVAIYDILGVVLRVDIGQGTVDSTGCSGTGCISNTIPLNIGIPGLSVRPSRDDATGGLTAKVGWHIHLALTLDKKDGFSILTKDQGLPEIGVGANIDLNTALTAELAFLKINITKHNTGPAVAAAFQIDLKSGSSEVSCYTAPCAADPTKKLGLAELTGAKTWSDVVDAQLNLKVDVDWLLQAEADAALPGIQARLVIGWDQVIAASTVSNTQLAALHIGFEDVALNAGDFLSGVLGPIVKQIKSVTGPVQPIIDTLYAPIPVLSDLSEMAGGPPVTLVTLAKAFSTIAGGPKLDFVDTVAKVITFVNNLPLGEGTDLLVPIGSFNLDSGQAWNTQATPDSASNVIDQASKKYKQKTGPGTYVETPDETLSKPAADIDSKSTPGKAALASGVASGAGFKFPILDKPSSIFNLLMGGDIDLVTFDSGPLTLGFTWRQSFGPVYAPPPVFITLSGSANVTARIEAGFDTYGLRKAFESGGTPSGIAQILNGLYFKSTNDDGTPLPVVTFYGEIAAGAAVSAVVITVGIEGGVSLTINLAWNDPNGDGKFRLFEFGQVALNNPICLFQMSGRIGLFLRVYITIGFSPFSVSFSFTLADITLLDFNVKPNCDPPPPRLGGVSGSTLIVFAGKLGTGAIRGNSAWDNTGDSYGDDVVKVTELHNFADDGTATKDGVKIEMLGITETWSNPAIDRVVVDGRGYGHNLKVSLIGDGDKKKTSKDPEVVPTGGFDLKAVVLGGNGDDTVKTGSGESKVDAGGGKDTISLSDAPTAGTSWVAGGPGDDSITTGNASAVVAGDSSLSSAANKGTLTLTRADGMTPATVTVPGIVDWDALSAPTDAEAGDDGNDRIAVGRGTNSVYGNAGDDAIGVAADSPVPGGPTAGVNTIVLGSGADTAKGGSNSDTIWTGQKTTQSRGTIADRDVDGVGGDDTGKRNVVDTGAGSDTVFGSTIPDFVTTGSTSTQKAVVTGGNGDDVLLGGFGTDELFGGPGKDWVVAEPAQVGDSDGSVDALGTLVRSYTKTPLPAGVTPNSKVLVGGDNEDRVIGGDGASSLFGDRYETAPCGTPVNDPESTEPVEPGGGTPGRDLITGGNGIDKIKAGGAADKVLAYAGNDLICGQAGDDEIYAGDDADTVWGGSGDDLAFGENGADSVYGNTGADQLYGGNQNDVIEGNEDSDKAYGGAGDDLVVGGTRAAGKPDMGDTLYGDTGDDTIIGDNGSNTYPYDLDGLTSSAGGADTIWAGPGADKAYGGLANDTIHGGTEADHLEGNNATDSVYGEAGEDEIIGGSSEEVGINGVGRPDAGDTLSGGDQNDVIVGDNAEVATVALVGAGATALINGRGFTQGHTLGMLDLGDAPDTLNSGHDIIHGDSGNDVVIAGGKVDDVFGDAGDDYLEGNAGADVISGGINADDIVGGSSSSTGGSQPDTGDTITGDQDDDVILGDNGNILRSDLGHPLTMSPVTQGRDITERSISLLDLGAPASQRYGNDTVNGNDATDVIFGEAGDDTLHGDASDDYIEGDQGADTITGDGGEDDLVGGSSTPASGAAPTQVGQPDVGDVISGGADADVITGDNASVLRVGTKSPVTNRPDMADQRAIQLQDLGNTPTPGTSGDDVITGDGGVDVVLAEGGSDAVSGNDGDDYLEGDQGTDLVEGNDGQDDILGGGAAMLSTATSGETAQGQPDAGDYLYGGAGQDFVLGDNAVVLRAPAVTSSQLSALTSRYTMTQRSLRLLDVNLSGGQYLDAVSGHSGDDAVSGGSGADVVLAQDGNDAVSGGPGEDWVEGNGGVDTIFGDQALGDTVPAPLVAHRSTGVQLNGDASEADGQDDLIGGSSNIAPDSDSKTGRDGFRDGNDTIYGDGADDYELGDNGTLFRDALTGSGQYPRMTQRYAIGGPVDLTQAIVRHAIRLDVPANSGTPVEGVSGNDTMRGDAGEDFMWGQTGDDTMNGNDGNDDMYGELGNDTMFGDAGDDAMLGDRGGIVTRLVDGSAGDPSAPLLTMNAPPAETFQAFRNGMLDRRVDQLHDNAANASNTGSIDAFATTTIASDGIAKGGVDKMRGGLGRDAIHGEGGDDLLNGDSGGDIVFGDDGNDVMWGGRGCDPVVDALATDCKTAAGVFDDSARGNNDRFVDYLISGNGGLPNKGSGGAPELIDWRPRGTYSTTPSATTCSGTTLPITGSGKNPVTIDPCSWFLMTNTDSPDTNVHQAHNGTDWMYGGWDRDVMEGDVAANGPNPGDRMIDWTGAVNLYNHCNSAYGGFNDVRQFSPEMQDFLQRWAYANGAGQTLTGPNGVLTAGTSGYNELALVYNADVKHNSGPAYATTPGHFEDFSCAP